MHLDLCTRLDMGPSFAQSPGAASRCSQGLRLRRALAEKGPEPVGCGLVKGWFDDVVLPFFLDVLRDVRLSLLIRVCLSFSDDQLSW